MSGDLLCAMSSRFTPSWRYFTRTEYLYLPWN